MVGRTALLLALELELVACLEKVGKQRNEINCRVMARLENIERQVSKFLCVGPLELAVAAL